MHMVHEGFLYYFKSPLLQQRDSKRRQMYVIIAV